MVYHGWAHIAVWLLVDSGLVLGPVLALEGGWMARRSRLRIPTSHAGLTGTTYWINEQLPEDIDLDRFDGRFGLYRLVSGASPNGNDLWYVYRCGEDGCGWYPAFNLLVWLSSLGPFCLTTVSEIEARGLARRLEARWRWEPGRLSDETPPTDEDL